MRGDYFHYVKSLAGPLLAFSCAAMLCLCLIRFVAVSQWTRALEVRSHVGRLEADLSVGGPQAMKNRLSSLHDSLSAACAEFSGDYGEVKDVSGILRLLIAKANAANIQFVKMHPQTETASETSAAYPLILETTASYQSLGRFIASMEALPRLVRVDRVAFTAVRGGNVEARILITCFLHANG